MDKPRQQYKRNPDIIFRSVADEAILVPVKRNVADLEKIYTLNEVAAQIWQLLEKERTLDELCEEITKEFDAERPAVEADIRSFLNLLLANQIIEKS